MNLQFKQGQLEPVVKDSGGIRNLETFHPLWAAGSSVLP